MSAAFRMRRSRWLFAALIVLLLGAPAASSQAVGQVIQLAPHNLSFVLEDGTPLINAGIYPSDVVGVDGLQAIPCWNLGLLCLDPNSGLKDQIYGFSFGNDFQASAAPALEFSVGVGSTGMPGSAVNVEVSCNPPEPHSDIFVSDGNGSNAQLFDGNGQACGSNAGLSLGLTEGNPSDHLRDFAEYPCPLADANCDGLPEQPVFFSLAPGSPSLSLVQASSADILLSAGGFTPVVYANGVTDLGLSAGDVIDAMCVRENGNGIYDQGDIVMLSLAPGSPTLNAHSFSPADIIKAGPGLSVFFRASSLGLLNTDKITGLSCAFDVSQTFLPAIRR